MANSSSHSDRMMIAGGFISRMLNAIPWPLTLGVGLGVGLGAGALLGVGGWLGQGLCLLAIGLALRLGWNAQPVLVGAPVPPPAKKPKPPPPEKKPETAWPPREPRVVVDIPGLLEMVELPGGTFLMGSPDTDELAWDNEKPKHRVAVSAFAIARCPVTRRLYREIFGKSPSAWEEDRDDDPLPANYLNWFEAVNFCNALSTKRGLLPCYHIDGDRVEWDHAANGYRLPTEAEWEYAARAGTATRWFCGDNPTELSRHAWFAANAGKRVQPVGTSKPNPWGLYDMSGNVWEWCWDWYGGYSADAAIDPIGASTGVSRVLRGGAYWAVAWALRSADRFDRSPEVRNISIGVRCVRGAAPPAALDH